MASRRSVAGVLPLIFGALSAQPGRTQFQTPLSGFEVASVKKSHLPPPAPGTPFGVQFSADGGRLTYKNATLRIILTWAYAVKPDQIIGPAWLDSERYEINATVPPGANKEQVKVMTQNLLAERFKLTLHREAKAVPVYELVVGKNGTKLALSKEEPPAPINGHNTGMIRRVTDGQVRIAAKAQTISELTGALENQLGRRVIDKTGLIGRYDFNLNFAQDMFAPSGAAKDDTGPSVFSAVQNQLGLKLEKRTGSLDVLIVDHADKVPTEN